MRWGRLLGAGLVAASAQAHHGIAGLGGAGLEGPGAPVEASSSATLPQGRWLAYFKVDHADWEKLTAGVDDEADTSTFWMLGLGYGLRSWLSLYAFLPYNQKRDEDGVFDTSGWADVSLLASLGLRYDGRLRLVPASESLDDLEDWHFTVYAGSSLPTGDPDLRAPDGTIDPGKSTGFGTPAPTVGVTATRMLSERLTVNLEAAYLDFQPHTYADGSRTEFGAETRLNAALIHRLHVDPERRLRVDGSLEAQYLGLGRDVANGVPEVATGGGIVYLMPGVRAYWGDFSVAGGVKWPVWTRLNEEAEQQGGEGKEDYRIVFTMSLMF
jgi:hypothetical protein